MLHQVDELDLGTSEGKQLVQRRVGLGIDELGQFGFDASNCPGGREELLSNSPQDEVRGLLTWLK